MTEHIHTIIYGQGRRDTLGTVAWNQLSIFQVEITELSHESVKSSQPQGDSAEVYFLPNKCLAKAVLRCKQRARFCSPGGPEKWLRCERQVGQLSSVLEQPRVGQTETWPWLLTRHSCEQHPHRTARNVPRILTLVQPRKSRTRLVATCSDTTVSKPGSERVTWRTGWAQREPLIPTQETSAGITLGRLFSKTFGES